MSESESLPNIVARSFPEANQDLHTLGADTSIVSIGEPETGSPYGFDDDNPLHLRLEFHDVLSAKTRQLAGRTIQPPTREHIRTLLDEAPVLRTTDLLYCHCNAGISRAPATAFILRCHYRGPGDEREQLDAVLEDRPQASPNRLMVEYADDLLERDGAMVDALDAECRPI